MEHSGTRIFAADRWTIWRHLISPESLAHCIPGCDSVAGNPADGFEMIVRRKVGPFRLHFAGTIELVDVVPARKVTLVGRGKGGIAGLAEGDAQIRLADHPDGTELTWDLGALLDGRVARLGHKPIDAAVATMTGRFLDRLEGLMPGGSSGTDGRPGAARPPAP